MRKRVALAALALLLPALAPCRAEDKVPTTLYFDVPTGAKVQINGVRTSVSRAEPQVVVPPMPRGKYTYRVTVTWAGSVRELSATDDIAFEAGTPHRISLHVGRLIVYPVRNAPPLDYAHAPAPKRRPGDDAPARTEPTGPAARAGDRHELDKQARDTLIGAAALAAARLERGSAAGCRRAYEDALREVRASLAHHTAVVSKIDAGLAHVARGDGVAEQIARADALVKDVRALVETQIERTEVARAEAARAEASAARLAAEAARVAAEAAKRRPVELPKDPVQPSTGAAGGPVATSGSGGPTFLVYGRTANIQRKDAVLGTLDRGECVEAIEQRLNQDALWIKVRKEQNGQLIEGWVDAHQLVPAKPLREALVHILPHSDGSRLEIRLSQDFAKRIDGMLQNVDEDTVAEVANVIAEVAANVAVYAVVLYFTQNPKVAGVVQEVGGEFASMLCKVLINMIKAEFKAFKAALNDACRKGDVSIALNCGTFEGRLSFGQLADGVVKKVGPTLAQVCADDPAKRRVLEAQLGYYATMTKILGNIVATQVTSRASWTVQNVGE